MAKKLEVRVPHDLSREEIRQRLDDALVKAREEYAATVGPIEASWQHEDRMQILVTVMGMRFDGNIDIFVEEVVVQLELPGMASFFATKIQDGIQERLGGLIGSQQA